MLDSSAECTDDDKISLKEQLKEFEQQVNLCNAQITDLQQKLIDADQGTLSILYLSLAESCGATVKHLDWIYRCAVQILDSPIADILTRYETEAKPGFSFLACIYPF